MNLFALRQLLTPSGQAVLQAAAALAPREVDFLAHFAALSRQYPADLARAALETAILRREAASKFPFADQLYLTREALEQASAYPVAAYRAGRLSGCARLLDLGCSVGGDSLTLAAVAPTLGLDRDPLRLALALANAQSVAPTHALHFLQADLANPLPFARRSTLHAPPSTALFFDPARRAGGRRIFSVEAYHPPLSVVQGWLPDYPALAVKLSPGVDLAELAAYDAEVEFISLNGELKEAVLWFGPLKRAARRATLLPGPHMLCRSTLHPPRSTAVSPPLAYLYEPDPAILRAGLVTDLGEILGAAQLDPEIAYLTVETLHPTPFARCWAVEDWFPFQLKRLRAYLRQRGIGRLTVKKRGSPLEPEALIHDLKLKGDLERVIFLTQHQGRPIVIVAFMPLTTRPELPLS
jgi:SAM-dependent methyltransferase